MDLPTVAVGAPQRLAVDRDRPSPPIMAVGMRMAVGKPGADHSGQGLGVEPGKSAADRGLGGDHPVAGEGVAAGAERGTDRLGCVGGPLGDRGHRPRTGQDCGGGKPEDGDQRVAAPGAGSRVGDGGQVGEQVRWLYWSERVGITKRGQARRDRG
jgi:hypothetical protein